MSRFPNHYRVNSFHEVSRWREVCKKRTICYRNGVGRSSLITSGPGSPYQGSNERHDAQVIPARFAAATQLKRLKCKDCPVVNHARCRKAKAATTWLMDVVFPCRR